MSIPKINAEAISTADLLRLEVQYRNPETIEQALALRGVEAELLARRDGSPEELREKIRELQGESRQWRDRWRLADADLGVARAAIAEKDDLIEKLEAQAAK